MSLEWRPPLEARGRRPCLQSLGTRVWKVGIYKTPGHFPRLFGVAFCNIRVDNVTPLTDCGENNALSGGARGGTRPRLARTHARNAEHSPAPLSDAAFGIGRSLLRGGALDPRARLLLDVLDQLVVRGGARVGEVPGKGVSVRGQGG